jgi:peptide/nickel transport system substrate-binding protein
MRVSTASLIDTSDSNNTSGAAAVIWLQNSLNNLLHLNSKTPRLVEPDLAERWEYSDGGRVLTLFLRRGVTWWDGKPFTAADAKYSLERSAFGADPQLSYNKSRLSALSTVTAVDDSTLRLGLTQPSASFLGGVAAPYILMYPAHMPFPEKAADWAQSPMGTGPYKVKEWKRGVSRELERNTAYFKKNTAGQQLPFLDRIQLFLIQDQLATLAAFRSGNINCACGYGSDLIIDQVAEIKRDVPGAKIAFASPNVAHLQFSNKAPLQDLRVRRAISMIIDRVQLNRVYRDNSGYYPPGYLLGPEQGGQWGLSKDEILKVPGFREPKSQDIQEARALFAAAGVDLTATTFDLLATTPAYADLGEAFANVLLNAGVKVRLQLQQSAALNQALAQNNFQLYLSPSGAVEDDPNGLLLLMVAPGAARNYSKWEDPEVTRLINTQETTLDSTQRRGILEQLQRAMYDRLWVSPLISVSVIWAAAPSIEDIELERPFLASSFHRMERVWINR